MTKSICYPRERTRQSVDETFRAAREVGTSVGIMHDHTQGDIHIRWLEGLALLDHVKNDARRAAKIARSIEWLRGKRGRTLLPAYVVQYEAYETAQRLRNEGKEQPQFTEEERARYLAKKKTANILLKLRRAETKPRNAAFLDDPSLLPKRPPSRVRGNDE